MHYHILHETLYRYGEPVILSRQLTHLTPRTTERQSCLAHTLTIDPVPTERIERTDYFGNPMVQFATLAAHSELRVAAESRVHVEPRAPLPEAQATPAWESVALRLASPDWPEGVAASQFVHPSPNVPRVAAAGEIARGCFTPGRPILDGLVDLVHAINENFHFDAEATTVATPLAEVIAKRRGVCQDFAHLGLACLRSLGLAARYVSGYLLTRPPPGRSRMVGADASHAWLAVFVPDLGWVDADPTNDLLPDDEHITLGWGRDFGDVSPLRGVILGGGEHEVEVRVTVEPMAHEGREAGAARAG